MSKSLIFKSIAGAGLLFLQTVLAGQTFAESASEGPYLTVKTATDELLVRLIEVQPLYETDPAEFFNQIDSTLGPFVDFIGFSRGVMAKYYRRATDAQKSEFAKAFRKGLIETYAKVLVEFENRKVIVLKPDAPQKKPGRAEISLQIYAKDGSIYTVVYSLVLMDEAWKLRNLTINGINLGLQFRSQFSTLMGKYKKIDKVIAQWSADV